MLFYKKTNKTTFNGDNKPLWHDEGLRFLINNTSFNFTLNNQSFILHEERVINVQS